MILTPRQATLLSVAAFNPAILRAAVPLAIDVARLRDFQADMLDRAIGEMHRGSRRVLLQAPTGAGKTFLAAALLSATSALGWRSQFIVHRKELIEQTSDSFLTNWDLAHSYVAAGKPFDPDAEVLLAGVQTLANRLDVVPDPHLIVVDEAHHATAGTWERVMFAYPDAWIIGLTATPERLDGRGLEDHFDVLVDGPSTAWLIERGYLSRYTYYAPGIPDLSQVSTVAGDFNRGGLGDVMDRPKLIGDVVDHYRKLAGRQQGIVFAVNREHSRHLAEAFQAAGVPAAHVDGEMNDRARGDAMISYRTGATRVLTNVDLFGEGLDVPGIGYVGLARPTKSLSLFLQQVGRGLRPAPGKTEAIICDHAGNAFTHGLPDDVREWSLEGRKRRSRSTNDDAIPIRQCLVCYRVSFSTATVCPGCGTPFPKSQREIEQEAGELAKLERIEAKRDATRRRKAEEQDAKSYEALVALGEQRNYPNPGGWARGRMRAREQIKSRFRRF